MARLPVVGGDNNTWGTVLNDYLQQALDSTGKLVTGATNSYTGNANTNLSSGSTPGLVQLTGDLGGSAASPTVTGLQGYAVATTAPTNGYVLTWDSGTSKWKPAVASGGGGLTDLDGGASDTNYGGVASIDGGDSS